MLDYLQAHAHCQRGFVPNSILNMAAKLALLLSKTRILPSTGLFSKLLA